MKKNSKNRFANYLIIAFITFVSLAIIRNWYFETKLQGKTKSEIAIIENINSGTGVKQIQGVDYFYYVNEKRYSGSDNGNFNFMNTGDTVLIKYSIDDNSISEVLDKYYMKKYKHLKK